LREIMTDLVNRAAVVVQRYGGTVGSFTGDGIMAVFGAPAALEDHAFRACLAALGIQEEAKRLAVDVRERDGVELQLRVGLNSGQVIAGEIGSGPFGYTAVGEQVGMAQRMESVAPPGGVMLSASTARLVDGPAALDEREMVRIKGAAEPVRAQRLLGMSDQHRPVGRAESKLFGRQRELSAVASLLDRAIDGHGAVVGTVGPPGDLYVSRSAPDTPMGRLETAPSSCSDEPLMPRRRHRQCLRDVISLAGERGIARRHADRIRRVATGRDLAADIHDGVAFGVVGHLGHTSDRNHIVALGV